jgi:hypothetical protein
MRRTPASASCQPDQADKLHGEQVRATQNDDEATRDAEHNRGNQEDRREGEKRQIENYEQHPALR